MNKILVDTNVLVYSIDQDSKYFDDSSELLTSKNEIFISSKSLSEFFSVVTRAPISSLSISDSLKMIQWFSNNFKILFPDRNSLNILFDLTEKYKPRGLKIYDFEIASIGLAHKIRKLATFNSKDFSCIQEIEVLDLKQ
ncbi:MAG: type II toxin-antitoxin system VapC family toxin [Candidatus Ozemobacteraceae bacterium]